MPLFSVLQAKPHVLVLDVKEVEHSQHTAMVLDHAMRTRDMDNERFLRKVRARLDAWVHRAHGRPSNECNQAKTLNPKSL